MNNYWNRMMYKVGSPLYDKFFNSGIFLRTRKQIFESVTLHPQHRILFVGVGTGADLELIQHQELDITAIDYSPDMLGRAQAKFKESHITFMEMDAQHMTFEDEAFDYVVASLIVSVVPDANRCFQDMIRVLKPGGTLLIFDKFAPANKSLSLGKLLLRPIIRVLGTDIGRRFEELLPADTSTIVVDVDEPVMLNGMYRKIMIRKIVPS